MLLRVVSITVLLSSAAMAANSRPVCPGPAARGSARCHSHVVADKNGNPQASGVPSGYGPTQFQTAYSLPSTSAGSGQTIAIVDAFDDPNIESDLGVYSSQYGLPACTTANGCFKKVNQTGGTSYPRANSGWALEIFTRCRDRPRAVSQLQNPVSGSEDELVHQSLGGGGLREGTRDGCLELVGWRRILG